MISFFPTIYDDEILYSVIARYHYNSGNINYRDSIQELFNDGNIVSTIEFPSRLSFLEQNLPINLGITDKLIIQNHTLFPLYSPFIPELRKKQLEEKMKWTGGKGIKTQIGFVAGGICKKDGIMYCPKCIFEDINKYGEAYFHRVHQVEGVIVCPEHGYLLKTYPVHKNEVSRLEFIALETSVINNCEYVVIDNPKLNKLKDIAIGAKYLLSNTLGNYDQVMIHRKYRQLLNEKGFITSGGHNIKQWELYQAFKSFYSDELLDTLESNFEFNDEYNWLKVALRERSRVIHPIRNILLILFFCNSIDVFFKDEPCMIKGEKRYPCLNPVCKNYRKLVITKHTLSYDYKSEKNVITLYCDCGFVYSRKENDDIYKLGRIKEFGEVWESKLRGFLIEKTYSLRQIGKLLGCDPKTIIRYAEKLNLKHLLNTSIKTCYNEEKNKPKYKIDSDNYKESILNLITSNPTITRQRIRKKLSKEYMWLYKNDKQWFDKNMPKRCNSNGNNNNMNVSWEDRDNIMLRLLENEYDALMKQNMNSRITKSLLGRRINMLALIEKKLYKLPKTKRFLDEILETVEDFQIRRINNVCFDMSEQGQELLKWKVVRKAGLKDSFARKLDKQIEINILRYRLNK